MALLKLCRPAVGTTGSPDLGAICPYSLVEARSTDLDAAVEWTEQNPFFADLCAVSLLPPDEPRRRHAPHPSGRNAAHRTMHGVIDVVAHQPTDRT